MVSAQQIKPHMPVVCSKGGQFAVVDHTEGTSQIKLAKDNRGEHHYIPLAWVVGSSACYLAFVWQQLLVFRRHELFAQFLFGVETVFSFLVKIAI